MRLTRSLSFRQKILVLPGVAAVALALLLVITWSLGIILGTIAASVVASLIFPPKEPAGGVVPSLCD